MKSKRKKSFVDVDTKNLESKIQKVSEPVGNVINKALNSNTENFENHEHWVDQPSHEHWRDSPPGKP